MRVISGTCRGRKLTTFKGNSIRPTSDRVKEAVFNIIGADIKHARVLDLFAGTGSLGIEALSRGADQAVFLDLFCDVIKQNINRCRLEDRAVIHPCDIIRQGIPKKFYTHHFHYIFMDPPYGKNIIEQLFLNDRFFKQPGHDTMIITEQFYKETLKIHDTGLDILRQKKYSKTKISFITARDRENGFEFMSRQ